MAPFLTILAALFSARGLAKAAAIQTSKGLPNGVKLIDLRWTGPIYKDGRNITFEGHLQTIANKIREVNPDYALFDVSDNLPSPQPRNKGTLLCGIGAHGLAYAPDIRALAAQILGSFGGMIEMGPGPSTCGTFSCNDASAIYICNDNAVEIRVSLDDAARMAVDICDKCSMGDVVMGQEFATRNFNVLVGGVESPCGGLRTTD